MSDITNPIFTDETKAREYLESLRWADGRFCPHCGESERTSPVESKHHREGFYYCLSCKKSFSVTVGTVMERSHIPLNKWVAAFILLTASKKGISAHQLHRMLKITYKSAWFMAHRIREAMTDPKAGPLGGKNKVVEANETYVGGKAKNRKNKVPSKEIVFSLVQREGKVRSRHVADVTGKTLRDAIVTQAKRSSYLMTDEAKVYSAIGDEFAWHGTVNHSAYFWHTNTVEGYFSILKRGITGVYHQVSPAHLHRYLAEFDFRYNEREKLGVDDAARAAKAIKGIEGKRLTNRRTSEAANA